MPVATPVLAWVSTLLQGVGMTQSTNYTCTVSITQAWQIVVPIIVRNPNTANISAGSQIQVYRSLDGGASYDSVALQPMGLARPTAAQVQQVSLKLETGQYCLVVTSGGGQASTFTVSVLTSQTLTSILNQ